MCLWKHILNCNFEWWTLAGIEPATAGSEEFHLTTELQNLPKGLYSRCIYVAGLILALRDCPVLFHTNAQYIYIYQYPGGKKTRSAFLGWFFY